MSNRTLGALGTLGGVKVKISILLVLRTNKNEEHRSSFTKRLIEESRAVNKKRGRIRGIKNFKKT